MKRQFSVPYNGSNPKEYLKKLKNFMEFVHDVYLGLPEIPDFFSLYILNKNKAYYKNCEKLLQELKNSSVKTVITLNADYREMKSYQKDVIADLVLKNAEKYSIHGVVCSDLMMAKRIHAGNPSLEINTSCNCPHYRISHLTEWRKLAGVSLVNPPRDISRNLDFLKELKDNEFRTKVLVNEPCYVNCPNICSFCSASSLKQECFIHTGRSNPLNSCIIFPEWLPAYDNLVDIYKITGRYLSTEYIFKILEIYSSGKSCKISDIIPIYPKELDFSTDSISRKPILDCNKTCGIDCNSCHFEFKKAVDKFEMM